MKKKQILEHWQGLEPNQKVEPDIIPYKHRGSTYDEDGIRITGSEAFIDSVLSHLKPLLEYEDGDSRLQVSYQESKDRKTGRPTGKFCCYIQVHERGGEAKIANALASAITKRKTIISKGY